MVLTAQNTWCFSEILTSLDSAAASVFIISMHLWMRLDICFFAVEQMLEVQTLRG